MQNKRGISAVVATVLIILITVAAVSIVWVAVIPIVKTNLEIGTACINADVLIDAGSGYTCYDAEKKIVAVQVKKGANEVDIPEIEFLLGSGGTSEKITTLFNLDSNAGKIFYLLVGDDVEEVSVAPIIKIGNKERVCDISSSVKLGGSECSLGEDVVKLVSSDRSCLGLYNQGYEDDGVYWIDPDGSEGEDSFQVNCDMTRDGGGWTQIVKTWYVSNITTAGAFHQTGAVGDVSDGLSHLGSGYKLSDESIRQIIGPNQKFDILADQSGYNTAYSTGNYEYVILRDYTGYWKFDGPVLASSTTTTFQSYRKSDDALAWTGNLQCGYNAGTGVAGINCVTILSNNPQGGAGCDINMGTVSNAGWHHFFMSQYNQDTYLYICNGAQHSSWNRFSHRFWVRESS